MSRILFLLSVVALLFTGCAGQERPDGVMDTATLAEFITEAHLIESYAHVVVSDSRAPDDNQIEAAYDSLYARLGITPADYDSTMDYYSHHPRILEDVYTRVLDRLREKKQ